MPTPSRRFMLLALGSVVLVLVGSLSDQWAYAHLFRPGVDSHDWGRLFRVMGFLPLWWGVGLAARLEAASSGSRRRASLLITVPTVAGLVGEGLKILIRRERPGPADGVYVFRSFSDRPFSTKGLGMPSSHAIVAFAAATVLARLWPRGWPIWYGLAAGCALTRVLAHAHFLSDVVAAALAGSAVAGVMWRAAAPSSGAEAAIT